MLEVIDRDRAWLEWVLITSVPLRRLDNLDNPVGFASGCFVDFTDRLFLLTVSHAVERSLTGWVIDLGYEKDKGYDGNSIFRLPAFNYLGESFRGSGAVRDVDFCFVEVPKSVVAIYQNMTPRGIFDEHPRHVFKSDLATKPDEKDIFAFAGQIKPEMHGKTALVMEMAVYPGLRFLRSENEFHVFELPVPHPGHGYFRGCSGAPIVDRNKRVVALVCNGDLATNTIRGVSIARYRFAFEFICRQARDS